MKTPTPKLSVKHKQHANSDALTSINLESQASFDLLQEGVQIHDFNWKYIYVNKALVAFSTHAKAALLGKTLHEVYPDIKQTALFKVMERCMKKRITKRIVTDFTFPNGLIGSFELSIVPIPEGILVLSIDRSEQKKVNEKLLKIKDLYAFISQVNQGILRVSEENELYRNSCQIAVKFGKFKMAWVGLFDADYKTISMIEHCGLPKEHLKVFKELSVYKNGPQDHVLKSDSYYLSNDIQNESNLLKWAPFAKQYGIYSVIVLPFKKSGKIIGTLNLYSEKLEFSDKEEIDLLLELSTDISFAIDMFEKAKKHKATEELVLQNEKRFRALIEKSPDMQSLTTEAGTIVYGSSSIGKVLGYQYEEYLNIEVSDFIHPDDFENYIVQRNKITALPGKFFLFELRLQHKNGTWIWCEGTITNMLHIASVNAFVANFRDVTQRKLDEDKLMSYNDKLQKTNFELDRFVYSVSHDLRSPLSSVLGLLWFIEEETKESSTLKHAAMIRNSINRLDEYIKNILNYSRNSRMELIIEKIDLQKKVDQIIQSLLHIKQAEGISFEVDIQQKEPFYSDNQSLHTVIENLISNAIKFQDRSKTKKVIAIVAKTTQNKLTLVVRDNGIGIAAHNHAKIFDMFFRVSGEIVGSGIGLYIVKEIIEKLHGSIKVDSEAGKQTSFTMQFKNLKPQYEI